MCRRERGLDAKIEAPEERVILFVGENCPICEALLARVDVSAVAGLRVMDASTVEGAAEADWYDVFTVPTLVDPVMGFREPRLEKIVELLEHRCLD